MAPLSDNGREVYISGVLDGLYAECTKRTEQYSNEKTRSICLSYTWENPRAFFMSTVFNVYSNEEYKEIPLTEIIANAVNPYDNTYDEKEFFLDGFIR